jgi:uncharacterized protein YuzB (UPF0349 family)
MIQGDVEEEGVTKLHKQIVEMAHEKGGGTTNRVFRKIAQQEDLTMLSLLCLSTCGRAGRTD